MKAFNHLKRCVKQSHFKRMLISSTDSAYNNDDYCLLLSRWALTWDARADSGSTLVFTSKEFLFAGSNWVLQSMDLKQKRDRWCTSNQTWLDMNKTFLLLFIIQGVQYLEYMQMRFLHFSSKKGALKFLRLFLTLNPSASTRTQTIRLPIQLATMYRQVYPHCDNDPDWICLRTQRHALKHTFALLYHQFFHHAVLKKNWN